MSVSSSPATAPSDLPLSGRRVLVPGGLGFLGLNLVPALLAAGASVRLLNRSADPLAMSWLEEVRDGRSVEVCRGDIAETGNMRDWIEGVDVVVNLAGESGALKSVREAQMDMRVNVAGHLNLLDALREAGARPRVIFVSSRLVYGVTGPTPVTEDHPTRPTSLYGVHKLTVENYHRLYWEHYGIPYVVLRVTNPYGPYQLPRRVHHGVLNRFIMAALRGEAIQLYGGGGQLRDYISVKDVTRAVLLAATDPRAIANTFNVGFGAAVSIQSVTARILGIAGSGRLVDAPWPAGYRTVETGDFLCDVGRIRGALGWSAGIDLDTGLRETVDAYRKLS